MEIGMILALTLPFLGTVLGAGVVFGLSMDSPRAEQGMNGFASGAMLGALFWNLLLPGTEQNPFAAAVGICLGIGMVMCSDELSREKGSFLPPEMVLILAVVIHNIPEGMAVGLTGGDQPGTMIGIALQNIPDGAVVAVPLAAMGMKRWKAFLMGVLSGAVEPAAALGSMVIRGMTGELGAGMMGFAAGAMLYVVIRELTPRMGRGKWGMLWFCAGLLMILVMDAVT